MDYDIPISTKLYTNMVSDQHPPASLEIAERAAIRYRGLHGAETSDWVSVEEPLQIRLAGEDVAVTMRTPGHDQELAAGFLFGEGVIAAKSHIEEISHCPDPDGTPAQNIVNILPTDRALLDPARWGRNFYSNSSCGLCGKTAIDQVVSLLPVPAARHGPTIALSTLYTLEGKLRDAQRSFASTGGLHAAGLFDAQGNLLLLREDVGRHNAVDKVIGYALLNDILPLQDYLLVVSSRASFEIVQKSLRAGIAILAAMSAPSSLAVDMAQQSGMTLIAFLRQGRLNVYSGEERVMSC